MKREKIRKNGFTLIELLAVIIILGILMIIAIPSVTSYINNSRKSAYVDTAKEVITGARNKVNSGELEMYDTNTTYYIPTDAIETENGGEKGAKSPYGEFSEAYVVVTYTGNGYNYYFLGVDETGQGVKNITSLENLDEDDIVSDITQEEIHNIVQTTGIGGRKEIKVLKDDNKTWEPVTDNATNNVAEGGSGSTSPTNTAASTILATAQAAGQLNKIPNTNIYIFKGGTSNPPANYVKFNNETWRIIGIYNGQMKIIRVNDSGVPTAPTGFTEIAWNTIAPNPGWANSSLMTSLNTTYYNTLSDTAKGMIDENGSWDVGPAAYNATASAAYTSATTTGQTVGSTTHTTPWTGKVGLMSSYEYLYATGGGDSCLTTIGNSYSSRCGTATNDWLLNTGANLWTLSPRRDLNKNDALFVFLSGYVYSNGVYKAYAAVPAVFLKSDVTITGGDGTNPANAYILQ